MSPFPKSERTYLIELLVLGTLAQVHEVSAEMLCVVIILGSPSSYINEIERGGGCAARPLEFLGIL